MATGKCTHTSLMLVNFEDRFAFTCNGCRELGYGSCYTCHPQCDYHLHKDCYISRSTISHSFFTQGQFVFKQNDNAPHNTLCDACGMGVGGWRYAMAIDRRTEVSLHPCCMHLPHANSANGDSFVLTNKKLKSHNLCCAHCRHSGGVGWAYVLEKCNLAFHVKCIKEMHHQNWERNYYSPNNHHLNNNNIQVVNQDRGLNQVNQRRIRKRDLIFGAANIALYAFGVGGTSDLMVMMVELASNIWGSI